MTTKEKKLKCLKHYLKLEYDVNEYKILNIKNDKVGISFIAPGNEFIDPYIDILVVNFTTKEITGSINLALAKKYVEDKVDKIELFE